MTNFTAQLRHWSYHRQLLGQGATKAMACLKQVVGVYSTHPSGPLSLWARVSNFEVKDMIRLDQEQLALRTPAMRGSVYMLPTDIAHIARSACLPPSDDPSWAKRYSQSGRKIPIEFYEEWKQHLLAKLQTPMTVKELKPQTTVDPDKLKFVLNRMGYEGLLLRVGAETPRSNIIGYVNAAVWSKNQFVLQSQEESLPILAAAYLKAFGPARVKDFKWWAGINATPAKAAWAKLELAEVEKGYFILEEEFDEFKKSAETQINNFDLLPQWDCYTMGYAPDGRQRFVHPDYQDQIYGKLGATRGNGLGTILHRGLACGSWTSRFKGSEFQIDVKCFQKLSPSQQSELKQQFEKMSTFLQTKKIKITLD